MSLGACSFENTGYCNQIISSSFFTKALKSQTWLLTGCAHFRPLQKFENAALFLRLGLPYASTPIRQERELFFLACVASISVEQMSEECGGFRRFVRAKYGTRAKIRKRGYRSIYRPVILCSRTAQKRLLRSLCSFENTGCRNQIISSSFFQERSKESNLVTDRLRALQAPPEI